MPVVTDPDLVQQLDALRPRPEPKEGARKGMDGLHFGKYRVGNEIDLARGVGQGLLDPVEGAAQFAEHVLKEFAPDAKVAPDALRKWARDYRKEARSSIAGVGGEVIGNLAPGLVAGGLTQGLNWGSRLLGGAAAGAFQPVSGEGDFWRTKLAQAIGGGAAGATLPALAAQAGRLAPALTAAAGHMVGLPKWITHAAAGAAAPVSAVGTALERIPPGGYGRIPGMVRGSYPVEREDAEEEPAPARKPAPAPAPAPERPLPSWLTGLVTQAQLYGGQDAQTE